MIRTTILIAFAAMLSLTLSAADKTFGAGVSLKEATSISDLIASPAKYEGKQVQVKGRITEVCQMMGCWMNIVDDATGKAIRIKVKDGEIEFPKTASGKQAVAEGMFKAISLTKEQVIEQAKHEAEEQGRKFDPSTVKSGTTIYQIQGTGAVISGL